MFQLFFTYELHNSQIKIFLFTFFFNNTFKIYAFLVFSEVPLQIRWIPVQFSILDKKVAPQIFHLLDLVREQDIYALDF